MLKKVDISLLREGDVVRLEDLELAETWWVESVDKNEVWLEINNFILNKVKVLRKNPRRKKYVFVEVE